VVSEVQRELGKIVLKVGPNITYSIFVHEGTKPHWVPLDALTVWVQKKFNMSGKEVLKTAKAIQFKISKQGTAPKPFLKFVFNQYQASIQKLIGEKLKERFA